MGLFNAFKTKKVCPKGYKVKRSYTRKISKNIMNKGYTVRREGQYYMAKPKVSEVHVPASCVRDPKARLNSQSRKASNTTNILRGERDLISKGYSFRLKDRKRYSALRRAVEAYGAATVVQKLDAATKLATKYPDVADTFAKDRDWVRTHFR
jgi:hypothetical protein